MYSYAWYHWIAFFFIYCFLGWIFESTYVSLKEHRFVNRGFLKLPMLPIYGTGSVMMLWVSLPVQDNPLLVYIFGVIATTILEYLTGYVMEQLFKVRYWDYSYKKYNLHGYICLSSSVAWGFLTLLMTEVLHKPVERFVLGLSLNTELAFIIVVGVLFLADTIRSARNAFSMARALESMIRLKAELESMQVQMALLKAVISQRVGEIRDEYPLPVPQFPSIRDMLVMPDRLSEFKSQTKQKASELKNETEAALYARLESLAQRLNSAYEKRDSIAGYLNRHRTNLLKRYPTASSRKFAEALKELKDMLSKKEDQ